MAGLRMPKKQFLTIADLDSIAKYLGAEGWPKFKKMSQKKRIRIGHQILRTINKGE